MSKPSKSTNPQPEATHDIDWDWYPASCRVCGALARDDEHGRCPGPIPDAKD